MEKAVVILSGGMDSTTLLYDIVSRFGAENTYAISFDYGQRHKRELNLALESCNKLGVVRHILDLRCLNEVAPSALTRDVEMPEGRYDDENMKQTVVPNRNMVMLSLATAYAIGIGATKLYYGPHAGDHAIYPDCRPEFIAALKEAIRLCDWKEVELLAPYSNMDKGDIVILGLKLSVDYSLTNTCYNPKGDKACGKCGACSERIEAFKKAGIIDPIQYV